MTSTCECGCGGTPKIADQNDPRRGHVKGQHQRYILGHSGGPAPIPLEERFWENVDATDVDGCWPWLGTIEYTGYGRINYGRRGLMAHRVSYQLTHGAIPDGLVVRHTCDNKPCVNPAHLLLGTHLDNVRDALERDRLLRGSRHPDAKLTEAQVVEIGRLRASGMTQYAVADRFGVHRSTIKDIDSGHTWTHVARHPAGKAREDKQ